MHHVGRCDDGDVAAGPLDLGYAQRHLVLLLGHVAGHRVALLVLEAEDGVVVADGGGEQALGVVGGGRHDHLQAGDVAEHGLQALGVLGGHPQAAAAGAAHHDGQLGLAAEHVAHLGHLVNDLVEGNKEEVYEHDLHHRPQAGGGRPHGQAEDGRFGDGSVNHPLGPEPLKQAQGDPHGGMLAHVLAGDEDGGVAFHLLLEGFIEGHEINDRAHSLAPCALRRRRLSAARRLSARGWPRRRRWPARCGRRRAGRYPRLPPR